MGLEEWEKRGLYAVTAAVLHLGEIDFKQRPRSEQVCVLVSSFVMTVFDG